MDGGTENVGRYAVVQEAARALLDSLAERYEVRREQGPPGLTLLGWKGEEVVRLVPRGPDQAELALSFAPLPGVGMRFGRFVRAAFPHCGCDACDESPDELVEEMIEQIQHLVASTVTEWSRRGWRKAEWGWEIPGEGSERSSTTRKHADPGLVSGRWQSRPWSPRS